MLGMKWTAEKTGECHASAESVLKSELRSFVSGRGKGAISVRTAGCGPFAAKFANWASVKRFSGSCSRKRQIKGR